jgi:hypothetical protein
LAWWLVPCLPFPGLPHIYFLFTVRLTNERVWVFLAWRSVQHLVVTVSSCHQSFRQSVENMVNLILLLYLVVINHCTIWSSGHWSFRQVCREHGKSCIVTVSSCHQSFRQSVENMVNLILLLYLVVINHLDSL